MPKERRARSVSFEARSRASPYLCIGSSSRHRGSTSSQVPPHPPLPTGDIKEWDEVRCPVCMEHPHNAVLLLCTSSDQGCHPFMCDTSYRHSNCLDQYKKAFSCSSQEDNVGGDLNSKPSSKLSCPLCRGGVTGSKVVESARRYMDSKVRSCSKESCGFIGSYRELRKHARTEHPLVRPSEANPDRQRDWRRMEQQWDLGDLYSTMRSAMGGEEGGGTGGFIEENGEISLRSVYPISSVAVLFIFRFTGAVASAGSIRTLVRSSRSSLSSRVSSRSHRGRATNLWGETYNEPELAEMVDNASPIDLDDDDDEDDDNDDVEVVGGGDGGNGSGEVDVRRRPGQGRHRRQLRMPQEEIDDDDLS